MPKAVAKIGQKWERMNDPEWSGVHTITSIKNGFAWAVYPLESVERPFAVLEGESQNEIHLSEKWKQV